MRSPIKNESKKTLKAVLEGYVLLEDAVISTDYYDILPGDNKLEHADLLFSESDDKMALKEILQDSDYDYIIIDSAPHFSILYDMAFIASDYLIIPVDTSPEAVTGIVKMKAAIDKYRQENITNIEILGTLLWRVKMAFGFPTNINKDRYELLNTDIKNILGVGSFKTYIRETDNCSLASNVHMPINEVDSSCCAAVDYIALADEIEERIAR